MTAFVKCMIDEHKELYARIEKLQNAIIGSIGESVNKIEYANMCMQLRAMKNYYEILEARLENQGIFQDEEGNYFEKVFSDIPTNTNNEQNINNQKA